MLVVHGTADQLVPYLQAALLVGATDKVGAPYCFHTVVGGGHNPNFGLKNAAGGRQNAVAGNFGFAGFFAWDKEAPEKSKQAFVSCIDSR